MFETLIFKERPEEAEITVMGYTTVSYGLYKEDGTHLGSCVWSEDKFPGEAWYLSDIWIDEEFQKQGYGTELLKRSCEMMWSKKKMVIRLMRAGDKAINRFDWFNKRGFKGIREFVWMYREHD